jgi:uncharacterized protein YtpQ (UPF0354 family)
MNIKKKLRKVSMHKIKYYVQLSIQRIILNSEHDKENDIDYLLYYYIKCPVIKLRLFKTCSA